MTKMTVMRGLSGSGKSTVARKLADSTGAVVVCRDNLREMLLGSFWTGQSADEDRVTVAERAQVRALLEAGVDCIVDATHLHAPYLRKWAKLAAELGTDFEVISIPTGPEHCMMRDRLRGQDGGRSVGGDVITEQARRFPMRNWPTITLPEPFEVIPYEHTEGLPWAVICDIDATIAVHGPNGRSPYDYSKVSEDVLVPTVRDILYMWQDQGEELDAYHTVLMVSGRDDTCYDDTKAWLFQNDVFYDELLMRPAEAKDNRGNKLADYVVKHQIFNEKIRGRYNIKFCLDDRRQVIDMYRKMGLTVLDVAGNNF